VVLAVALASTGSVQARPAGGRIMPPAQARQCQGDLTSYFGKVIGYKRDKASTWLKIATDYDTIEAVTIAHGATKEAATQNYLFRGRAFTAKDWARIESKPGLLRPGTRATAWVCNGRVTVVDWNGAAE
jgi:hypothetical protein